jgi:hypothetical protein
MEMANCGSLRTAAATTAFWSVSTYSGRLRLLAGGPICIKHHYTLPFANETRRGWADENGHQFGPWRSLLDAQPQVDYSIADKSNVKFYCRKT